MGAFRRKVVYIYEYTSGFVHAKMFVVDDKEAVVGTINLDYRSLYLHYECGTYFCYMPEVKKVEEDIQECLAKSQKITLEDCKREKLWVKAEGRLLKIIAPLL